MSLRGKTVLVVGSSSVGPEGDGSLGQVMNTALRVEGALPVLDGAVSRGLAGRAGNRLVGTDAQRGGFLQLLHDVRPDLTLIALGGNPSGSDDEVRAGMSFVRDVTPGKLVWFGPPVYEDPAADAVSRQLDSIGPAILGSRYHSSAAYTDPVRGRTADHVHFTLPGAAHWGAPMLLELQRASKPSLLAVTAVAGAVFGAGLLAAKSFR